MNANKLYQYEFPVTHGRGYDYSRHCHLVWCTKNRQKVFTDVLVEEIKAHIIRTEQDLDMKILALEVMPDYIHILADCKPQCRLSDAIKVFKGNVARWLFMQHPELKQQLHEGSLWNRSYFAVFASQQVREQMERYLRYEEKSKA